MQANMQEEAQGGLRSTPLGWEVGYEKTANACGGLGYSVRTFEELALATETGFRAGKVCIVNVLIEAGKGGKLESGWQSSGNKKPESKLRGFKTGCSSTRVVGQ